MSETRKFDPKFKNAGKQRGLQIWRIRVRRLFNRQSPKILCLGIQC